jgi:hypothetical protein
VTSEFEIIVNFVQGDGSDVHVLHLDVQNGTSPLDSSEGRPQTPMQTLIYLGATPEQMVEHESDRNMSGKRSSHLRLLPQRRNLLKIDHSKLR